MDFFGKCVPFHWQIPLVPVKFNAKKHKCKEELCEHKPGPANNFQLGPVYAATVL